jgi:glycerol uptake facilitator-like aquaporin
MDSRLRAYLTELIGTFVFVFLAAASVCAAQLPGFPAVGLAGIALAQGLLYGAILTTTTRVSEGCLNPAVALTLWVIKRFDTGRMVMLIGMQLLGAALAGGLVVALFDQDILMRARAGTPYLEFFRTDTGTIALGGLLAGVGIEIALTFVLVLTVFATVLDRRRTRLGGFGAGLALVACLLVGFHLTGAACNPARWFGPVLWQPLVPTLDVLHPFADHAAYWMGPILGGLLAGSVYTGVILPPDQELPPR